MKYIFSFILVLLVSSQVHYSVPFTPEKFLESYATVSQYQSNYGSNAALFIGSSLIASSMFLEGASSTVVPIVPIYVGAGFIAISLLSNLYPSEGETYYLKSLSEDTSAIEVVKETVEVVDGKVDVIGITTLL